MDWTCLHEGVVIKRIACSRRRTLTFALGLNVALILILFMTAVFLFAAATFVRAFSTLSTLSTCLHGGTTGTTLFYCTVRFARVTVFTDVIIAVAIVIIFITTVSITAAAAAAAVAAIAAAAATTLFICAHISRIKFRFGFSFAL